MVAALALVTLADCPLAPVLYGLREYRGEPHRMQSVAVVEGVEFLHPVEVGDLVSLKASVNYVGNTSMIVGMRVEALNPRTGIVTHTNSCYFTMAAKNEEGQLIHVPGLILENDTQIRRFYEGMKLKEFSLH